MNDRHHETSERNDEAKRENAARTPDQAEGERNENEKNRPNVGRTPGQAEGERDPDEQDKSPEPSEQ